MSLYLVLQCITNEQLVAILKNNLQEQNSRKVAMLQSIVTKTVSKPQGLAIGDTGTQIKSKEQRMFSQIFIQKNFLALLRLQKKFSNYLGTLYRQ